MLVKQFVSIRGGGGQGAKARYRAGKRGREHRTEGREEKDRRSGGRG